MTTTDTLYSSEATDPHCIEQSEAERMLADVPWKRLVVLGDSLAAGIREEAPGYPDQCFGDRLGEALTAGKPDPVAYVNLGIRDLTLSQIRESQLESALDFKPDLALVIGGGNDSLGPTFDEERFIADLDALIRPLAESGAAIATVVMFDLARSGVWAGGLIEALAPRFDRLDELTAATTAELGGVHVDTHHHPRAADPHIYASDRIHANTRGHSIAFSAIVQTLVDWNAQR